MKKLYNNPYFIFLLPIVFFAIKIEVFIGLFSFSQIAPSIVYFLSIYFITYLCFKILFKRVQSFNILFFISALFFLYFGYFQDVVLAKFLFKRIIYLIPILFCIILLLYKSIRNKLNIQKEIYFYFNILCVIIFSLQIVLIAKKAQQNNIASFSKIVFKNRKHKITPNIYFVLLDEYGGKNALKTNYNFDNSVFYNELKKRKFFVAEKMNANYDKTPLCMASMFNLGYINKATLYSFNSYNNYLIYFKTLYENSLFRFLKQQQIDIYNLSFIDIKNTKNIFQYGNFQQVKYLIYKDILIVRYWNNLVNLFVKQQKYKSFFVETKIENHNKANIKIFEKTVEISKLKSKNSKFVYSHVMLPHAPFYCDSNGKEYNVNNVKVINKEHYIPYLKYANKQILKLADTILNNDSNPVLIFMSDHGDRYLYTRDKPKNYNSIAFDNFFAIKSSNKNFDKIKSNVNVFRILLNTYFNQHLEMINDSSFNYDENTNKSSIFEIK